MSNEEDDEIHLLGYLQAEVDMMQRRYNMALDPSDDSDEVLRQYRRLISIERGNATRMTAALSHFKLSLAAAKDSEQWATFELERYRAEFKRLSVERSEYRAAAEELERDSDRECVALSNKFERRYQALASRHEVEVRLLREENEKLQRLLERDSAPVYYVGTVAQSKASASTQTDAVRAKTPSSCGGDDDDDDDDDDSNDDGDDNSVSEAVLVALDDLTSARVEHDDGDGRHAFDSMSFHMSPIRRHTSDASLHDDMSSDDDEDESYDDDYLVPPAEMPTLELCRMLGIQNAHIIASQCVTQGLLSFLDFCAIVDEAGRSTGLEMLVPNYHDRRALTRCIERYRASIDDDSGDEVDLEDWLRSLETLRESTIDHIAARCRSLKRLSTLGSGALSVLVADLAERLHLEASLLRHRLQQQEQPQSVIDPSTPSSKRRVDIVLFDTVVGVGSLAAPIQRADELSRIVVVIRSMWSLAVRLTQSRAKTIAPWVPDDARTTCTNCGVAFWLLVRRHHCRLCSELYCADCCYKRVDCERFLLTGLSDRDKASLSRLRVCNACALVVQHL